MRVPGLRNCTALLKVGKIRHIEGTSCYEATKSSVQEGAFEMILEESVVVSQAKLIGESCLRRRTLKNTDIAVRKHCHACNTAVVQSGCAALIRIEN